MTTDPTPIPEAPTPKTRAQVAAVWGYNAIETGDEGFDLRHARVAEAALSPESMPFPADDDGGQ